MGLISNEMLNSSYFYCEAVLDENDEPNGINIGYGSDQGEVVFENFDDPREAKKAWKNVQEILKRKGYTGEFDLRTDFGED